MGWDADIFKVADKLGASLDQAARIVNTEVLTSVVQRVPVDHGETKGAIVTSIGSPVTGYDGTPTMQDDVVLAKAQSVIGQSAGTLFYITIDKPWVKKLEFGGYGTGPGATNKTTRDGFSVQAPSGFMRLAVKEVANGIRKL